MKLFHITSCCLVLLLSLVAFAFVAVHPAAAQQALNPPPPSFETCKTVGNGTICQGVRTVTDPLAGAPSKSSMPTSSTSTPPVSMTRTAT